MYKTTIRYEAVEQTYLNDYQPSDIHHSTTVARQ